MRTGPRGGTPRGPVGNLRKRSVLRTARDHRVAVAGGVAGVDQAGVALARVPAVVVVVPADPVDGVQEVLARTAVELVRPGAAVQGVVAGVAGHEVVAALAAERVVVAHAAQVVVAAVAADLVVAGVAADDVVA